MFGRTQNGFGHSRALRHRESRIAIEPGARARCKNARHTGFAACIDGNTTIFDFNARRFQIQSSRIDGAVCPEYGRKTALRAAVTRLGKRPYTALIMSRSKI